MILNPKLETMSENSLRQLQLERLQAILNRVYYNVEYYKTKFDEIKFLPEHLKTLNDLKKLPFTTKEDLKAAYPYKMFAVPLRDIVQLHTSTGSTGKPLVVGYTRNDLKHWAELNARGLAAVGVTQDDMIQIAYHYGMTTGGLGFHLGANKLGASIIPASTGNSKKQIDIMIDYKTTVLACAPSYAVYLAELIENMNIDLKKLYLKIGIFGSEPWSEKMRETIETKLKIQAYDVYGLTEIIGPGVAFECHEKNGLHINEDYFLVELINPNTLQPAKEGEAGELVFTTLLKEGYPLIRYRTGDIAFLKKEKCKCGRIFAKISRIYGRSDDMIIVKGVKLFPSQIEKILFTEENLAPHYQIVIKREKNALDELEIKVEVLEEVFTDDVAGLTKLKDRLEKKLISELGLQCKVSLVEYNSIIRTDGKTKKVIDLREL
ncbi:MAG TPA: phenylacetate--CoA ligase [bacterium]|nr:phenylacetate--CoA ligase [bacterium]